MRVVRWLLAVALFFAVLYSFAPKLRLGGAPATPAPVYWTVPDFSLTDRSGRTITLADLRGHLWVADLFYTSCPGPCPALSGHVSEVQAALADDPRVRLVSLTSDPEADTPEKLQTYAERYHAGPQWLFLTGPKDAVYRFANDGLKLGLAYVPGGRDPITHGTKLLLIDAQARVRGIFEPEQVSDVVAAVHRLEKEAP